jgi:hypothetical protein
MRNAARAIPQVWSKTFLDEIVLLEIFQAVRALARSKAETTPTPAAVPCAP